MDSGNGQSPEAWISGFWQESTGSPQDLCFLMLKDPDSNFVEIVDPNTQALKKKKSKK